MWKLKTGEKVAISLIQQFGHSFEPVLLKIDQGFFNKSSLCLEDSNDAILEVVAQKAGTKASLTLSSCPDGNAAESMVTPSLKVIVTR